MNVKHRYCNHIKFHIEIFTYDFEECFFFHLFKHASSIFSIIMLCLCVYLSVCLSVGTSVAKSAQIRIR